MKIVIDVPEEEFGIDINDKFQDFFQRLKAETNNHLTNGTNLVCGNYELETIEMFLDAFANLTPLPKGCDIQRIIPKRVDIQKWIYTRCPNPDCECELSTHHGDGYYTIEHKPDFCPDCGQALLWEGEE